MRGLSFFLVPPSEGDFNDSNSAASLSASSVHSSAFLESSSVRFFQLLSFSLLSPILSALIHQNVYF
ncbi:hypothetical protein AKJ57_06335 [candidate division MSBL1 archaeon SCGC-AAA259A05]|uniref:Uncharacterized protein n=1 Tax=candidate division MSBL1 archaeon SCGC-AAA259A05 TaxID=1698259 RepID=A0A133U3L6_9EURY|nr:hypothetical protein AKJ57_06335 [candidate division MSBL1 archaeon SCGC-AAA259A05]